MEQIRILHVINKLSRGGMESRLMDIFRCLNRDRYQYDFYIESGNPGDYDEEVRHLGGKVFYAARRHAANYPDFGAFYRFLHQHPGYRIIYAYNQWAGYYLHQAKRNGVPYRIAFARTSLQTKSLKNTVKNLVKQNVNKYCTHRFAVSKRAANWLFGTQRAERGEVNIWPNAIDTERFAFSPELRRDARLELGLTEGETAVLHVGNIRFEKNHPFLLETFAKIKETNPNATLILVGKGSLDSLQSKIDALGIRDAVLHLGVRSDVPRILQAGDLFVFPSLYEGFPGAVLEAEASGLPCLISDAITEEVVLSEHVIRLPLAAGARVWAKWAEELSPVSRETAWKAIRDAGYDIHALAGKTQLFYQSLLND